MISSKASKKVKKERKKFIIAMIIFAMMFFVRDVFNINIPQTIFLLVACFYYIIFDLDECIAFTATLAVWGSGFQANYAILFGIFAILLKKYKKIVFSYEFILLIFIILWEALHIFIPPFSVAEYARHMVCYIILWIIIFDKNTKFDYPLVLITFAAVTIFVLFDILAQTLAFFDYSIANIISKGLRFGNVHDIGGGESLSLSNNQNFIGILCALSIGSLLVVAFNSLNKKTLISCLLGMLILVFFGLLTQSKTFILLLAICIIGSVFYYNKSKKLNFLFFIIIASILLCAIYFITKLLIPDVLNNVINRFLVDDISSGRVDIFRNYNDLILSSDKIFFFGIGMQSILEKVNVSSNVPHNALQTAFLVWGFLGVITVLLIFILLIINARKGKKTRLINYLPVILYFIAIQLGHFVQIKHGLMILILCFSAIRYNTINEVMK